MEESVKHIKMSNYRNIRDLITRLEDKNKDTTNQDNITLNLQLIRSWMFFDSDYNPKQNQRLIHWKEGQRKISSETWEWITIDILVSLASIHQEDNLEAIREILNSCYQQIIKFI